MLDQTLLPLDIAYVECRKVEQVWDAIRRLVVRGAPAIGVAAAYGVCLALRHDAPAASDAKPGDLALAACDYLATSRPTAVNLFWALDRMRGVVLESPTADRPTLAERLVAEAQDIERLDHQTCAAIGKNGADLLDQLPIGANLLTHCNAGALATAGDGTALAVLFEIARRGKRPHVWVDETRPLLQGARLTAWELQQRGIDCTLICDSMAAVVMRQKRVDAIVVGADRIAANGDAANKIGTYGLAVLASAHRTPFYVAAPCSTIDSQLASGDAIPIEERAREEIAFGFGRQTAPEGVACYNPAFDVTPAELITGMITEVGVIAPVSAQGVASALTGEL
ncbi:MAG: S-methyl-5-thioribose-1-phosphate isomerase [Planctomycetales bacterium]|nr:S-methyl-5-thioribose-1-phosphate isomerase [Planctomycetales bacterium]